MYLINVSKTTLHIVRYTFLQPCIKTILNDMYYIYYKIYYLPILFYIVDSYYIERQHLEFFVCRTQLKFPGNNYHCNTNSNLYLCHLSFDMTREFTIF